MKKNFLEMLQMENPDIIGLQETKWSFQQLTKKDQAALQNLGYYIYWNAATRPGYSGTAALSKIQAKSVYYGINPESFDHASVGFVDATLIENHEWRVVTLEFENHYYVTVYTPNSKDDLSRLPYRYDVWDKAFLQYVNWLQENKPVIICGDLNVAHTEIDLARPKQNTMSAWFTQEERERMSDYIDAWYIDTFREKHPDTINKYSWWSYRAGARARNVGWRIDYFLISARLKDNLVHAQVRDDIIGSDHCPVSIEINL
jgi:exodeoxyribonuclease-3